MANTTKKTTDDVQKSEIKETAPEKKSTPPAKASAPKILTKIDPNELIDVQSCTYGELIYISRKTGYQIIWEDFGAINMVAVSDLIDIRNGQKRFFEEPWIMLLGERAPVIIDYLQVGKYYKNISKLEDFDEIFKYDPSEITTVLKDVSQGTKEAVARRAYALIKEGELDSRKMIEEIEKATGFSIQD